MTGLTASWDRDLTLALGAERRPWLTGWMKLLSVAGSGLVELPFALLLIAGLLLRRHKAQAGWYAAWVISGWALYALAKLVVQRPRPRIISHLAHGAGWYSYPSGHSMLAPLVFGLGVIAWTAPWRSLPARMGALGAAVILALAIGLSRVYVGSHYPTDVIGGLLLGTAWSALALWWRERRAEAR